MGVCRNQGAVPRRPVGRDRRRLARGGFTLLELTIVMSVLLVAFLGMSQAIGSSMALTEVNRESALGTDGAGEMVELLSGIEAFDTVFARFNDDPADDPGGPGTAPGKHFDVAGLQPAVDDADGRVGEILFPTVIGAGGEELREDPLDDLWEPRDLNGDGLIDSADHSGDYRLLPVVLRLRWQGKSGPRTAQIRTLIADR